jgi:RNA polymerase sigma-70 factor (ECF subfamily)
MSSVAAVLRVAYPKALSTLVRVMGSLDAAEDALQEAAARAVVHWTKNGVADNPAAWLVKTARNRAIDGYRRSALEKRHAETSSHDASTSVSESVEHEIGLRDDLLRLVFTCCHPSLPLDGQVALTLKAVAGLTLEEIARAFFVSPRTIEQRITRAKRRIRDDAIPYEVPAYSELPGRLVPVLSVVHLIFTEGHSASVDAPVIRHELCRLAIGQSRLLARLFAGESEVEGLLALLLLTHSRAPARLRPDGVPVPLDRQDRKRWTRGSIREGQAILHAALRRGRVGRYQIEAAISAVHCDAAHWEDTDWKEILRLYDALLELAPSPMVQLNRAVAVAQIQGPAAGLALVDAFVGKEGFSGGHGIHAVRAGLLIELEEWEAACGAAEQARLLTVNGGEIRYFDELLAGIQEKMQVAVGNGGGRSS